MGFDLTDLANKALKGATNGVANAAQGVANAATNAAAKTATTAVTDAVKPNTGAAPTLLEPGTEVTKGNFFHNLPATNQAYGTTGNAGYTAEIAGKDDKGHTTYKIEKGYDLTDSAQKAEFTAAKNTMDVKERAAEAAAKAPGQAAQSATNTVVNGAANEARKAVTEGISKLNPFK